jgi:hypothetical protein
MGKAKVLNESISTIAGRILEELLKSSVCFHTLYHHHEGPQLQPELKTKKNPFSTSDTVDPCLAVNI